MPKKKIKPKAKKPVAKKKPQPTLFAKRPKKKARTHMETGNVAPPQASKPKKPASSEDAPFDIAERRKELLAQAEDNEKYNDEQVNTQAAEIAEAAANDEETVPPTADELREQAAEQAEAEAALTGPEGIKKFEENNKKAMAEARKK